MSKKEQKITILYDMDGVLADFDGAVRELFEIPDIVKSTDYNYAIAYLMERDNLSKRKTLNKFWTTIKDCPDFWLNLKPIDKGIRLLKDIAVHLAKKGYIYNFHY